MKASLTPEQRAEQPAQAEDDYWAQVAAEAAEPYDPREDKYLYVDDDEGDAPDDTGAGYVDEDEDWDGDYR